MKRRDEFLLTVVAASLVFVAGITLVSVATSVGDEPVASIAEDLNSETPAASEKAATPTPAEPTKDEPAQIVLMIGDRPPVTLASGTWEGVQIIVAQVALAIDALQWRELRARMTPQQTKERSQ